MTRTIKRFYPPIFARAPHTSSCKLALEEQEKASPPKCTFSLKKYLRKKEENFAEKKEKG